MAPARDLEAGWSRIRSFERGQTIDHRYMSGGIGIYPEGSVYVRRDHEVM